MYFSEPLENGRNISSELAKKKSGMIFKKKNHLKKIQTLIEIEIEIETLKLS